MPKRLTRAFYAMSAAAIVATSFGLSVGTASANTHAPKDTAACGTNCVSVFSRQLGSGTTLNAFVPGDTGSGGKVGQKVNMRLANNTRPNGDWTPDITGFVFQFCGFLANDFFSPTSYVCLHYPFFAVIEMAWSPFGNQTTLCAGVKTGGVPGENVTLQTCGASANTVWIADRNNEVGPSASCLDPVDPTDLPVGPNDPNVTFCPWINGGDTAFSQPLVLTLNTGTTKPQNQLFLEPETHVGGVVKGTQLFAYFDDPVGGV